MARRYQVAAVLPGLYSLQYFITRGMSIWREVGEACHVSISQGKHTHNPAKDLEVSWPFKDRVSHMNETAIPPQAHTVDREIFIVKIFSSVKHTKK